MMQTLNWDTAKVLWTVCKNCSLLPLAGMQANSHRSTLTIEATEAYSQESSGQGDLQRLHQECR